MAFHLDEQPLVSSHAVPVAGALGYLAIVYLLRVFLPPKPVEKQPRPLVWLVFANNMLLAAAALVMLVGEAAAVWQAWDSSAPAGALHASICDPDKSRSRGSVLFWVYVFYLTKYWELLDTVFLVLMRKELQFLHVYHHAATVVLVYDGLVQYSTSMWVAVVLNSAVHVPMYWYYAGALVKWPAPWWKRHLTMAQTVQFMLNIAGLCAWAYWHHTSGGQCAGGWRSVLFSAGVNGTFFVLFRQFAKKRYGKGGAAEGKKEK